MASVQSLGSVPLSSDFWKRSVTAGARFLAHSFKYHVRYIVGTWRLMRLDLPDEVLDSFIVDFNVIDGASHSQ